MIINPSPWLLIIVIFILLRTEAEEKKLREASLAASSRLKRVLLKEKETKESLQKALNEAKVGWTTHLSLFVSVLVLSNGLI